MRLNRSGAVCGGKDKSCLTRIVWGLAVNLMIWFVRHPKVSWHREVKSLLPQLAHQPWHFEVKEVDWDFSVLSKQRGFYSTKSRDDEEGEGSFKMGRQISGTNVQHPDVRNLGLFLERQCQRGICGLNLESAGYGGTAVLHGVGNTIRTRQVLGPKRFSKVINTGHLISRSRFVRKT